MYNGVRITETLHGRRTISSLLLTCLGCLCVINYGLLISYNYCWSLWMGINQSLLAY